MRNKSKQAFTGAELYPESIDNIEYQPNVSALIEMEYQYSAFRFDNLVAVNPIPFLYFIPNITKRQFKQGLGRHPAEFDIQEFSYYNFQYKNTVKKMIS